MLESERAVDPEALTMTVAEAGATVVCAAWIRFERDTEFATLWGRRDLAQWRRRGIYRATVEPRRQARLPLPRDGRLGRQSPDPRASRLHRCDDDHAIRLVAADGSGSRALACAGESRTVP